MHANARLTPIGRLTMVLRIEGGRPVAHVAAEMGISRPTAYKWWHRWDEFGAEGLVDRSSRPKSCPHRTAPEVEAQIEELRRTLKLGPVRIGYRLGVPASTVHRVLARLGINRLSWMDRPTGQVIRRYERERTGELVHVDIKKLGKIPDGGGWKVLGRAAGIKNNDGHGASRVGYGFIHSAVDDHSRLAYWRSLATSARRPRRLLGAGRGVVLQLGNHDRGGTDGQRELLSKPGVRTGPRRHQAPQNPPLPPPDQRQSRAIQPHHAGGMGLHQALRIRSRTGPGLRPLPALQITAATCSWE